MITPEIRELYEVFKLDKPHHGLKWAVQLPVGTIHFWSELTARQFANANKWIDAKEGKR